MDAERDAGTIGTVAPRRRLPSPVTRASRRLSVGTAHRGAAAGG
jgi:hypothetical protein